MKPIEILTHPMLYAAVMLLFSIVHSFLKWNQGHSTMFLVASITIMIVYTVKSKWGEGNER